VNALNRRAQPEPSRKAAKGRERKTGAKCPICDKPVVRDHRPFCSKHCADIDLGHWLGGRYVVAGGKITSNEAEADE